MKAELPILLVMWLLAFTWTVGSAWGQPPGFANRGSVGPLAAQGGPLPGLASVTPSAAETNAALPPPPQGQVLLEAAIRELENRQSVSAKINQQVNLFGKQLQGDGTYLEQRPGRDHLMRLELRIVLGDEVSNLVQVCDGRYLWIYRKLLDDGTLSQIDVARVVHAMQEVQAAASRGGLGMLPGLGGLPRLLRGLYAAFDFQVAEKGRLEQLPVWILRGQWKPAQLAKIFPEQAQALQQGKPANWKKAPEHLPDSVIVLLGQNDLFPYRTEYYRKLGPKERKRDDQAIRALVSMDLFQVTFNVPIDPNRFVYNPGNAKVVDQTTNFIEALRGKE